MDRTTIRVSLVATVMALLFQFILPTQPLAVTGQSGDPPARPTGLGGTVEHDRVSLTWDDPQDDSITGYRILRGYRVEGEVVEVHVHVDDTGSSQAAYVDTDVQPETNYVYRVRARNTGGLSPVSSDFYADTPAAPPAPTLIGTELSVEGHVLLLWRQEPADRSVSGYRILRGPDADSLAVIEEDTGSISTAYADAEPPAGQKLFYAVQSRSPAGISDRSNSMGIAAWGLETE